MTRKHCVVVGAGLAGASSAWWLKDNGWDVTVYETEYQVGGNLRSGELNGVPYEPHGPHIFHTNSGFPALVVKQNCDLIDYRHTVKTVIPGGRYLTWPLQLAELKELEEWPRISAELDARPAYPHGIDFESYAVTLMGKTLYEWCCEHYTRKQWGMDPRELSSDFAPKRLDLRRDNRPEMFRDLWQGWCRGGWHTLVENLLSGVEVVLGNRLDVDHLPPAHGYVITAPLDEFLGVEPLPWRGVRTEFMLFPEYEGHILHAPVVNAPNPDVSYTRRVETKQMAGYTGLGTVIGYEYPGADVKHYPVHDRLGHNRQRHRELVAELKRLVPNAVLAGRLANYVYIDMDQAIMQGVNAARKLCGDDVKTN